jgi:hypothetical protein
MPFPPQQNKSDQGIYASLTWKQLIFIVLTRRQYFIRIGLCLTSGKMTDGDVESIVSCGNKSGS